MTPPLIEFKAKEDAEITLRLATCDGGEYKYKVAYEEAERMLKRLKAEQPSTNKTYHE